SPACASELLLKDLLRKQWGFDGQVVSDCGAISDITQFHRFVATRGEAAALSVKAGFGFSCLPGYRPPVRAVNNNLLTQADIDTAVSRVLAARFKLGMFDPPEMVPYSKIETSENDTPAHRDLSLKMARESIVLLKNNGALPIDRAKVKRIAVV